MPACLIPMRGEGTPLVLDGAIVLVGRHPDCDIVITDSRKVSRRHCCIANVENAFLIRDLGSVNGVRVNGELVREAWIKHGDILTIGDVPFQFALFSKAPGPRRAKGPSNAPREPVREQVPASRPRPAPLRRSQVDLSQELPVPISEEYADSDVVPVSRDAHRAKPLPSTWPPDPVPGQIVADFERGEAPLRELNDSNCPRAAVN